MKLSKTAERLLAQARRHGGRTSIQWGLDRGSGGTGKLRPFGERDRQAAATLCKLGLMTASEPRTSQIYVRGYASHVTDLTLTLKDETGA